MKTASSFAIVSSLLVLSSSLAFAGESDSAAAWVPEPVSSESDWEFKFTPYLWTASMEGTVGVRGIESDVDVDFSDIFEALDFTWASTQELHRKGSKWSFFLDTFYVELGPDTNAPIDDVTLKQALIDAWIGYRVVESECGWIDLTTGVRWNYLDLDIDTIRGRGADGSQDWWDPHVGFRYHYDFNERVYSHGIADIGGFDVGSELAYQVSLAFGYRFNETFATELGARYLSVDYSDGGFVYDVETTGLVLGVAFTF